MSPVFGTHPVATLRSSAVLSLALLAAACGASESADDDEALARITTGGTSDAGTDAGSDDADAGPKEPGSPYFLGITANGTGCPRGTWETKASADGSTFTVHFKSYEASTTENPSSVKDCLLAFKIGAEQNRSYALTDFSYYGHAKLDDGVTAFATLSAYFQGNPAPSIDREERVDLKGPLDEPFVLHSRPEARDLIWSPCGVDRNLNVVTRVGVQKKARSAGEGAIALEGLGNPEDLTLSFTLASRLCRGRGT